MIPQATSLKIVFSLIWNYKNKHKSCQENLRMNTSNHSWNSTDPINCHKHVLCSICSFEEIGMFIVVFFTFWSGALSSNQGEFHTIPHPKTKIAPEKDQFFSWTCHLPTINFQGIMLDRGTGLPAFSHSCCAWCSPQNRRSQPQGVQWVLVGVKFKAFKT